VSQALIVINGISAVLAFAGVGAMCVGVAGNIWFYGTWRGRQCLGGGLFWLIALAAVSLIMDGVAWIVRAVAA